MKKRKYDVWYWEKIKGNELGLHIKFWNEDKSECYSVCTLSQMLDCLKKPTKEAREKFIKDLKKNSVE